MRSAWIMYSYHKCFSHSFSSVQARLKSTASANMALRLGAFDFEGKLNTCHGIIDYIFEHPTGLLEALNMDNARRIPFQQRWVLLPKNTRLAVYGDSVASVHLCRQWVRTQLDKGRWTTIRGEILSNANLARVGFQMSLDSCLFLNAGTLTVSPAMMATAVEAILGAVHLDGGDGALATVMENLGLTHHDLLVPSHAGPPRLFLRPADEI